MTTDPIAAARALIEPLTGYTPDPWTFETESGDWPDHSLIGGSGDPVLWWDFDLGFRYSTADAALIAAAPDLRGMVATLADALEAERAEVAAAYEAAARDCARQADQVANAAITGIPEQARQRESMEAAFTKAACRIRALTPPDAQAALNRVLSEARAEGWRAGREAAAQVVEDKCAKRSQYALAQSCRDAIRALPEPKENSNDH